MSKGRLPPRDSIGRVSDTWTFLPGVGFRSAGTRLARPASVVREGLTLTVRELVCTPEGTDLVYEITDGTQGAACLVPGPGPNRLDSFETVTFRDGDTEHRLLGPGPAQFSSLIIPGGVRRTITGGPVPTSLRNVEVHLRGGFYGEWSVPVDLVPFGADDAGRLRPLEASVSHDGITVRLRGMSVTDAATAIHFEVAGDARVQRFEGVGGLHGMRRGATNLALRDEHGRGYAELPQGDSTDSFSRSELAVFEPLAAHSRELELELPFVYVVERETPVVVPLPVQDPVSLMLGPYPIRILSTGEAPDSPRRRNFGPALAIHLDLGGWRGDRRVLFPSRALVDGEDHGIGYGNGINATAPEPVDLVEVRMPEPLSVKELTLLGVTVQVRGPWRLKFARPE